MARAQALGHLYPSAAEFLRFYREIARFQKHLSEVLPPVSATSPVFALNVDEVPDLMGTHADTLLELLTRVAPRDLATTAAVLSRSPNWSSPDPAVRFINRVLLQPYAENMARSAVLEQPAISSKCPFCGELPIVALGKRSLLCSLCATEWQFPLNQCLKCGEADERQLPIFNAGPFPHLSIAACDTCHTYLKTVELTGHPEAVPDVEELASLPLDLWAAQNQYVKLQPNLFGL